MFARFFIERPVLANVIAFVTILLGAVATAVLPVSQYPPITPPTVQVTTSYPGASAKTLVETVALPIEQQVNGVEKMLYMQSNSLADGRYTLTVTFQVGTDLDFAQVLVQNRVAAAMAQLPRAVQQQGVITKKKETSPLQIITLSSKGNRYDALFLGTSPPCSSRTSWRGCRASATWWSSASANTACGSGSTRSRCSSAAHADRRRQRAAGRERVRGGGAGRHATDTVGPGVPADRQRAGRALGSVAVRPDHPEGRQRATARSRGSATSGAWSSAPAATARSSAWTGGRPAASRSISCRAPTRSTPPARGIGPRHPRSGFSRGVGVRDSVRHDDVCEGVGQRGVPHVVRGRCVGAGGDRGVSAGLAGDVGAGDDGAGDDHRGVCGDGDHGFFDQPADVVCGGAGDRDRGRRRDRGGRGRHAARRARSDPEGRKRSTR